MKIFRIATLALALGGLMVLGTSLDAGEGKKCKYSEALKAEGKKKCSLKDKQACDWTKCDKADCDKHAQLWDEISVSDFYEI